MANNKAMGFLEDERGIAYSMIMIVLFVVLASVTMIFVNPFINDIMEQYDEIAVSTGMISEITIQTLNFQILVLKSVPFLVAFFGVFMFGIVRALYLKRAAGGA